ncbi:glycosyltransferase [Saccharibacter sp. 17.LH.SD]|uniref:glycosyltransferase family protein n=1 Tax=Saccharibacter sp. 17.LH.SD TaxID=2689393 RepID=UPI00136913E8|nr:glycosyltransferase [Saccharibacter sp. 17.LH.SD]
MAVIYNTNYTHNPNSYLTLAIKQAAELLFGKDNVVVADNMSLGGLAASGEHDTFLCIDGQRLNTALMRRVRPAFRTMILWTFEDPFMKDFNVEAGPLFDFIFTNDPSCVTAYGEKGHYLPLAGSRWLHERPVQADGDFDYDLFFAGTMWPNRVQTLRRVIAAFPDARLKLICPGNEYLPPLPDDIANLALQRPVSHEAFIDFANASAVTLTMFRDYASHGDVSQATAPGPRFFELALAGAAQVVEVAPGMDPVHFKSVDGVSLAYDPDEVVEAVGRLLNNKAGRRRSAIAAQKAVLKQHLYEHRLEQIRDITGADFKRHEGRGVELLGRRNRLRVLLCTHSTIHEQEWGGVEVYQRGLCSLLGRDIEFFYWLRRGNFCRLITAAGKELECFEIAEQPWQDVVCDAAEETMFSGVISQYNIDVVHFQHLGHHALSLPLIAKANGTGVVFSAHDFWLVSSRYNLLNQDWRYVEGEFSSVLAMDVMLKIAEGVEYGGEQTRRAFISRMLHHVDAVMFGTEHSRNLMHTVYPVLDRKMSLVNGIPSPETTVPVVPKEYTPLDGRPLGVAIVGNFLRTKGADTILSLIEVAHPAHFHFHIFGYIHPDYQSVFDRMERSNVTVHGRYDIGSTTALKQADVSLALSIWPETYCISLSEAWQHGLVPIVTDIGALGDRVTDGVNGFKVPVSRPDIVLERLELLRSSDTLRKKMMEAISPKLWTHEGEYGEGLLALYRRIAPRQSMGVSELQFDAGQLHLLPFSSWRHQAPPRHIFDPPIRHDLSICLPPNIQDWFAIQGAQCYVDDICHCVLSEGYEKRFKPADEFHIRGWTFLPGVTTSGQVHVVLISDQPDEPLIFIEAAREIRSDISRLFGSDVPRRTGFAAQAALRGKWCEGRYRIGLVNVINGRGAFQLLSHGITVEGSKIKTVYTEPPSNDVILSDFRRVLQSDGILRGIRLSRFPEGPFYPYEHGVMCYFIDAFDIIEGTGEDDPDRGALFVRGWSFLENLTRSGQIFVAMVSEDQDDVGLFAVERFARGDVQVVHRDAPLCSGFHETLRPWQGQINKMEGRWKVVLVNFIGDLCGMGATELCVTFKKGRAVEVDYKPVSREQEERMYSLISRLLKR